MSLTAAAAAAGLTDKVLCDRRHRRTTPERAMAAVLKCGAGGEWNLEL